MESPHDCDVVHWDHQPTPNPSQEGSGQDADERLLPSWEGPGVGRLMESLSTFELRISLVIRHSAIGRRVQSIGSILGTSTR